MSGDPVEPVEPAEAADEREDERPDVAALRKEAVSRRLKLRDAERERDALSERLTAFQRREAERLATTGDRALADGADLWVSGVELGDLLDEAGDLDADKLTETRDRIVSERPHWKRPAQTDFDGGARPGPPAARPSFGEALRRAGAGRR